MKYEDSCLNHLTSETETNLPYYKEIKQSDLKPMIKAIDKNLSVGLTSGGFFFGCYFVRMLQGLVEGLISVSMSLILLSSGLDFFFVIRCPPSKSLTQMSNLALSIHLYLFPHTHTP